MQDMATGHMTTGHGQANGAQAQGNSAVTGSLARAHRRLGLVLAGVAIGMVGLAYAAVPLYRMFCQATGYNGTTQRASVAPTEVLARKVVVRFDANVAASLGWRFEPVERTQSVHIGETNLAFFRATNTSDRPQTGTAVFNVLPEAVGIHFNKLECFCFTEQTLEPGQSIEMPLSYFLAPEMARDGDLAHVGNVTLSYTFYPVAKAEAASKTTGKGS